MMIYVEFCLEDALFSCKWLRSIGIVDLDICQEYFLKLSFWKDLSKTWTSVDFETYLSHF